MTGEPIVWGCAGTTLPGEKLSGDRELVKPFKGGALVAVVDGLGHGEEAAAAAHVAVNTLQSCDGDSLMTLLRLCHERLRTTRGVVMSMALFNQIEDAMTWLGVGNVEGILFHYDAHVVPGQEFLLLRGGVVGDQLPRLHASIVTVGPGDTLIFATDGIRTGFVDQVNLDEHPQRIADRILAQYWRGNDDALVLVARYGPR